MADTPEETRVRTRKPDQGTEAATAADQAQQTTQTPATPVVEEKVEQPKEGYKLHLPLRVEGFRLIDDTGREIAMCGFPGDIARTGPAIAEALAAVANKEHA